MLIICKMRAQLRVPDFSVCTYESTKERNISKKHVMSLFALCKNVLLVIVALVY